MDPNEDSDTTSQHSSDENETSESHHNSQNETNNNNNNNHNGQEPAEALEEPPNMPADVRRHLCDLRLAMVYLTAIQAAIAKHSNRKQGTGKPQGESQTEALATQELQSSLASLWHLCLQAVQMLQFHVDPEQTATVLKFLLDLKLGLEEWPLEMIPIEQEYVSCLKQQKLQRLVSLNEPQQKSQQPLSGLAAPTPPLSTGVPISPSFVPKYECLKVADPPYEYFLFQWVEEWQDVLQHAQEVNNSSSSTAELSNRQMCVMIPQIERDDRHSWSDPGAVRVAPVVPLCLLEGENRLLPRTVHLPHSRGTLLLKKFNPMPLPGNPGSGLICDICNRQKVFVGYQAVIDEESGNRENLLIYDGCNGFDVCVACMAFLMYRTLCDFTSGIYDILFTEPTAAAGRIDRIYDILFTEPTAAAGRIDRSKQVQSASFALNKAKRFSRFDAPFSALAIDPVSVLSSTSQENVLTLRFTVGLAPLGAYPTVWRIRCPKPPDTPPLKRLLSLFTTFSQVVNLGKGKLLQPNVMHDFLGAQASIKKEEYDQLLEFLFPFLVQPQRPGQDDLKISYHLASPQVSGPDTLGKLPRSESASLGNCPICVEALSMAADSSTSQLETRKPITQTKCGHWFHVSCLAPISRQPGSKCPVCRSDEAFKHTAPTNTPEEVQRLLRENLYDVTLSLLSPPPASISSSPLSGTASSPNRAGGSDALIDLIVVGVLLSLDGSFHSVSDLGSAMVIPLQQT